MMAKQGWGWGKEENHSDLWKGAVNIYYTKPPRGMLEACYGQVRFTVKSPVESTSFEMPGWMKHKLESRLPGELSITSDMQMTPPSWQKVKN